MLVVVVLSFSDFVICFLWYGLLCHWMAMNLLCSRIMAFCLVIIYSFVCSNFKISPFHLFVTEKYVIQEYQHLVHNQPTNSHY